MKQSTEGGDPKIEAAAKAYIYGYPLVYNLQMIRAYLSGAKGAPVSGPVNEFAYARELLGPDAEFVSPNNDTLYIIAVCDVRSGNIELHVPDTADRYYVLQFVDAWTNNFAYIGRRATGTAEGRYLLVPWDYAGDVPDGMNGVVRVPGGLCAIVGRIQINSAEEAPAVHALQDGFTLTPAVAEPGARPAGKLPEPDNGVPEDLLFWEKMRVSLKAFPPPKADAPVIDALGPLGITADESPFLDAPDDLSRALVEGEKAGKEQIENLLKMGALQRKTAWSNTLHLFDYNLDYFSIGAIDRPEWKIAERQKAYVMRAIGARAGLWGNHGYEAAYFMANTDADGIQLNGSHRYEIKLDRQPPVDAFWSITMYNTPDFHLVANPIDRYSIGDRTAGLELAGDGSLTIYMQKDSPGPDKEANWLPAPMGDFRPTMRMYQPGEDVLSGAYVLPPIVRVDR